MVAAMTHHFKSSKPCCEWLTNGEVPCVLHQSCRLDWLGYLPVYHEGGRPLIVGVREYNVNAVAAIKVGEGITLMKGEDKHGAISVFPAPSLGKYSSGRPGPLVGVDITEKIIELWNVPELSAWWERVGRERIMTAKADSAKEQAMYDKEAEAQAEKDRLRAIKKKAAHDLTASEAVDGARQLDFMLPDMRERDFRKNGHLPKKG
jgi:hypothetical protein